MYFSVTNFGIVALIAYMDTIEDQQCIDRLKKGDTASFAFLVDKYKDMAFTISLKVTKNRVAAEDAVQESFIKAYLSIQSFKGHSKFSTWLYTIVYRTSLAIAKEQKLLTVGLNGSSHTNYNPDHSVLQLEKLEFEEQQQYINAAIDRLPKKEALLVTLYYRNENSIKEICTITGFSVSNVKIILFRARKKLENDLKFLL